MLDRHEEGRRAEFRMLRAAIVLGALLLAVAGVRTKAVPEPCGDPRPVALAGPLVAVACAGGQEEHEENPALEGAAALLFGRALDLDRATPLSLEVLPGIGPSRARAIADARRTAPFRSVEDLLRVRGIGPHTVAGLRGFVRAGDTTGASRAQPAPAR